MEVYPNATLSKHKEEVEALQLGAVQMLAPGLNLYVASGITRMGITELTGAVWPWLVAMLVFLVLITYVPGIALALAHRLGMR